MILKVLSILIIISMMGMQSSGQVVRLGVSAGCPYVCNGNKDNPGYIIEILSEALSKGGHRLEVIKYPYVRLKSGLVSNQFDIVFMPSFDIRNDYGIDGLKKIMGVHFYGIAYLNDQKYANNLSKLKFKKVVVTRGSLYSDRIKESLNKINEGQDYASCLTGVNAEERKISMLLKKRVDYILGDYNLLSYMISKNAQRDKITLRSTSFAGFTPMILAINSDHKMKKKLDKILCDHFSKIKKTGKLELLLKKYNIPDWESYSSR